MESMELSTWLDAIAVLATKTNVIVVPGGGTFAAKVRDVQTQINFDELTAHRLALLAMCQYGYLLASRNSKIQVIDDIGNLSSSMDSKLPLLWLPLVLLNEFSEIPASWDYTSDSIALWLAMKVNADKLLMVKSIAVPDTELCINDLIEKNHLDQGFKHFFPAFSGKIIWLNRKQHSLLNKLDTVPLLAL
jgi:aspartokinase-like uncharacterized kinase